jgi:RHS repeat-associated protein
MPGRVSSNQNGYRYGFNGKENDNEVKGTGNLQDYGMRIYDPRVGIWLSMDKLQSKNPGESPFLFTGGNPLAFIDADGNDRVWFNSDGVEVKRIKTKVVFATYVQIGTRTITQNGHSRIVGVFKEAPMPGVVAGYEHAKYQENDYQIAATTELFNLKLKSAKSPSEITNAAGKNHKLIGDFPRSIDVNLVKALAIQESGAGSNQSMNGENDIMQVNVGGDWKTSKDAKIAIGMQQGMIMTPGLSLKYGLRMLFLKGFGSDGVDQDPDWKTEAYSDKWVGPSDSWLNAIDRYNGGGASKYGQNYSHGVQNKLNSIKPAKPSNYVAPSSN